MCTPPDFVALQRELVISHATIVARPPIGAAGGVSLLAKPIAVVAISVVVGTVSPDPYAIPEDSMTMTLTVIMAAIPIEGLVASATVVAIAPGAGTVQITGCVRSTAAEITATRTAGILTATASGEIAPAATRATA